MTIEISKVGIFRKRYQFRIKNKKGKVLAKSARYKTQAQCEGVISNLKHDMPQMTIYRTWEWDN